MKRKLIIITASLSLSLLIGIMAWQFLKPGEFTMSFGQDEGMFRKVETKNLSPYAVFGDSSFVLMSEAERTGNHYIEITNPNAEGIVQLRMDFQTGKVTLINKYGTEASFLIDPTALAKFISVDPSAEKYPNQSPYNYVANNPVRLIDPDGREIWISLDGGGRVQYRDGKLYDESGEKYKAKKGTFERDALKSLKAIERRGGDVGRELVSTLANAPGTGDNGISINIYYAEGGASYSGQKIGFDPSVGLVNENREVLSPAGIIAHELGHGMVELQGGLYTQDGVNFDDMNWYVDGGDPYYTDLEEKHVIQTYEQPIARALGTPFNRGQHGIYRNSTTAIQGGVTSNRAVSSTSVNKIASEIQKYMNDPLQGRKDQYYDLLRERGHDPNDPLYIPPWKIKN